MVSQILGLNDSINCSNQPLYYLSSSIPANTYGCKIQGLYLNILYVNLHRFKIYLNEAAKKQHTITQACSDNMGYFPLKNAFLASLGVLQLDIEKNELNLSFGGILDITKNKIK